MIYGPPYSAARAQVGERRADEVATYSAVLSDYLRVPPENVLLGRPDSGPAPDERSLFPGFLAILLAVAACVPPFSRHSITYLILAIVAADLSLGIHGVLFSGLQDVFSVATSLRAPARFGVLVLLSVATLASIGAARLLPAVAASCTTAFGRADASLFG